MVFVSGWRIFDGFQSITGNTLTNSQQTARLPLQGLRLVYGRAVCIHSGRMAHGGHGFSSSSRRPSFPNSLLQRHAWRSSNGPFYGGPVEAHHLLLDVGASCSLLLLAVIAVVAWVVDRLLSKSSFMRRLLHAAVSSFRSYALSASCLAAVDNSKLTQGAPKSNTLFGFVRNSC